MDPSKEAIEAAEKLAGKYGAYGVNQDLVEKIIQAAIEKATEEAKQNAYNDGWVAGRDALRAAQPQPRSEHQSEHSIHPVSLCRTLGHEPPASSEPQEWTPERVTDYMKWSDGAEKLAMDFTVELAAERKKREGIENRLGVAFDRMVADYNRQLAAEREKREGLERANRGLYIESNERYQQLISAQAAIAKHNRDMEEDCENAPIAVDLSALEQHDAEARKPLVEELQNIVNCDLEGMRKDFGEDTERQFRMWAQNRARAALASVKEGK